MTKANSNIAYSYTFKCIFKHLYFLKNANLSSSLNDKCLCSIFILLTKTT